VFSEVISSFVPSACSFGGVLSTSLPVSVLALVLKNYFPACFPFVTGVFFARWKVHAPLYVKLVPPPPLSAHLLLNLDTNTILLLALLYGFLATADLHPVGATAAIDSSAYVNVLALPETVTMLANLHQRPSPLPSQYRPSTLKSTSAQNSKTVADATLTRMLPLEPCERNFFGTLVSGRNLNYTYFGGKGSGVRRKVGWETEVKVELQTSGRTFFQHIADRGIKPPHILGVVFISATQP
jgi:hypothetical protein